MIETRTAPDLKCLHVIGVKYGLCPTSIRETVYLNDNDLPQFLNIITEQSRCEALAISTCDRVEVYFLQSQIEEVKNTILETLIAPTELPTNTLKALSYSYSNNFALKHLFRVASSLDSQIIGEPQILGQIRASHRIAEATGTSRSNLNYFLQHAYITAKRVRSETNIAEGPVTLAAAAIRVARDINGNIANCKAAIFGVDDMSIFLIEQFKIAKLEQIIFIDQNPETISLKTGNKDNEIGKYNERAKSLATVDIAIIGSSNHGYLITQEMMISAIQARQNKPILIIDIGVPSAVDPAIERIDEAFVYNLDDLERLALEGKNKRSSAIADAENIILEEFNHFAGKSKNLDINSLVQDISNSMNEERLKLLKEKPLLNPAETSQLLLNRLLHQTITTLRELNINNEFDHKTEFLIRKLLISKNLHKGGPGEF